ncbi:MAG: DUF4418 family protein [Oscillospiraceae bacterium]
MKQKISGVISTVIAVLLTLGVMTVFRACPIKEDGTWMHCHTAQMDMMYLGLAMAVCSVVTIFCKQEIIKIIMQVMNMVLSVLVVLVPTTFVHMCMMDTMRCHAVMKPFAIVMSIGLLICNLVSLLMMFIRSPKSKQLPC